MREAVLHPARVADAYRVPAREKDFCLQHLRNKVCLEEGITAPYEEQTLGREFAQAQVHLLREGIPVAEPATIARDEAHRRSNHVRNLRRRLQIQLHADPAQDARARHGVQGRQAVQKQQPIAQECEAATARGISRTKSAAATTAINNARHRRGDRSAHARTQPRLDDVVRVFPVASDSAAATAPSSAAVSSGPLSGWVRVSSRWSRGHGTGRDDASTRQLQRLACVRLVSSARF
uniref:(northern house mosquito) hypothetical protein n=1 Tax=Culex pipiens TaxID=7175 RepID=A0A8D8BD37_CULPI